MNVEYFSNDLKSVIVGDLLDEIDKKVEDLLILRPIVNLDMEEIKEKLKVFEDSLKWKFLLRKNRKILK